MHVRLRNMRGAPRTPHLLLPMSMMTMLELECWRASSSQVVRWLKVSLLWRHGKHGGGSDSCTTTVICSSCGRHDSIHALLPPEDHRSSAEITLLQSSSPGPGWLRL